LLCMLIFRNQIEQQNGQIDNIRMAYPTGTKTAELLEQSLSKLHYSSFLSLTLSKISSSISLINSNSFEI